MKDRTQETLTLDCRLTDEEQRLRGVELVETTCKIKDLEQDAKGLKEQIRALTERSEVLAVQVRYKQEERPVLCRKVADWAAGTMTYYRQDTGEIAKVRALDGGDKQLELELVDRCEKAAADERENAINQLGENGKKLIEGFESLIQQEGNEDNG